MTLLILIFLIIFLLIIIYLIFEIKSIKNTVNDEKSNSEIIKVQLENDLQNRKEALSSLNDSLKDKFSMQDNNLKNNSENLINQINLLKQNLGENVKNQFETIEKTINDYKNTTLADSEKRNKTFLELSEKIAKITQAQSSIDSLKDAVKNFEILLTNKKSRGTYGEIQLESILEDVFGSNSSIYKKQYSMSNKSIVDAVVKFRDELIPIDSKFPLENYVKIEHDNSKKNEFIKDVKKHIDDIAKKYIILGETYQAFLFLPSDAIYAYIQTELVEVVKYGFNKKVFIVSPTTLLATITTMKNYIVEKQKYDAVDEIKKLLLNLSKEFKKYDDSFEKMKKGMDSINKNYEEYIKIHSKIMKQFSQIDEYEKI